MDSLFFRFLHHASIKLVTRMSKFTKTEEAVVQVIDAVAEPIAYFFLVFLLIFLGWCTIELLDAVMTAWSNYQGT